MDRVQIVESFIKTLDKENEEFFRDQSYYDAFYRLIIIIKRISDFIKDISQSQGYKKFLNSGSSSIRNKFNNLVHDFETVMKDLNFTTTIVNGEQREIDQRALTEDIAEMEKVIAEVEVSNS